MLQRAKDGPAPSQSVPSTSREGGDGGGGGGSENPNKTGKAARKAGPCLPTVPRGPQGPGDRDLFQAPQQPLAKLGLVVVYPGWVHKGPLNEDRCSNNFFFSLSSTLVNGTHCS